MPARPRWISSIDRILSELAAIEEPWVDRQTVQQLLDVQPRRAQQIMAPCVSRTVGTSALADRHHLIAHLRAMAASETAVAERLRRRRVAATIRSLSLQRLRMPKVLIEAPETVLRQSITSLPPGVELGPGQILVRFDSPRDGLEKLLALAMAVGNDYALFERLTLS